MRFLIFQHISVEHPGSLRACLRDDGIGWDVCELDAGDPVPDLDRYDALWVMGGPMDVWQEDEHRWLAAEKAAIREAVAERGLPYFGFCLGHQLLAEALGGSVGPAVHPEIGVLEAAATAAGRGHPLLEGIESPLRCLQWHGAEVNQPPPGATVLLSSDACRVQAMALGEAVLSVQFHVEIERDTVACWASVPEYAAALRKAMGPDALAVLEAQAAAELARFDQSARRLYRNWTRAAGFHRSCAIPRAGAVSPGRAASASRTRGDSSRRGAA